MGVYGYKRNNTPYLSSLAQNKDLQVMHGVHSTCNESACGLISMASSRFIHSMPSKPFTLHQVIKRHGYQTHMILGGDHTNFYALKAQYGKVDSYIDGSMNAKKNEYYINDDKFIINHTKSLENWDGKPVMFQFHLMSNHALGKRWPEHNKYQPSEHYLTLVKGTKSNKYINFYDNGVLQTDHVIKTLLSTLKEKKYLENAIVVITSDHGESLGEHNLYQHANSLHEEQLNIPLLLMNFSQPLKHHNQQPATSQVDIAPTILHELNIPIPQSWDGLPLQQKQKHQFNYFVHAPHSGLLDFSKPPHVWKYWRNVITGKEFVYNLKADPQENNNLASKLPKQLLTNFRKNTPDFELEK